MIDLALVIPTFKEQANVRPLLDRLAIALAGISYEVIFVDDDSPDGTAQEVRTIAAENPRVHVLQRIERRGLASACLEGMLATAAPYVAVMDADLQHDETVIPAGDARQTQTGESGYRGCYTQRRGRQHG